MSILGVGTSKAFRTYAERLELVDAIFQAPQSSSEHDWIEWKTDYDLGEMVSLGHVARHVLGMANRPPDDAAVLAAGCSYLILGVEPGKVAGVQPIDIADLSKVLNKYTGGVDGPRWDASYVDYRGKTILVVSVEPPSWGDPIHTLRRDFDKYKDGAVFIRRMGHTEPANSAEIAMLTARRVKGGKRLSMSVGWREVPSVLTVELRAADVDAWVKRERARLMAPVAEWRASSALPLARFTGLDLAFGERRSVEEYVAEVEEYLEKCRSGASLLLTAEAVKKSSYAQLEVTNHTDQNFAKVRCAVRVEGKVFGFARRDSAPDGPPSPLPFRSQRNLLGGIDALYLPTRSFSGVKVDNTQSVSLKFDPVDLRPRDSVALDKFILIAVGKFDEGRAPATWSATSTNADGVAEGSFEIPITGPTMGLLELLAAPTVEEE